MTSRRGLHLAAAALGLTAVAFAQDAISNLRAEYVGSNALCRVKVNGLRSGTDLLGRPVEVRVVNGAVLHGAFVSVHNGRDVPVAMGQLVRITDISPESAAKFDAIRVTVVADGSTIPIAFVLPKGSLSTLTAARAQELLDQVLERVQPQAQTSAAPAPTAAVTPQQTAPEPQRTALTIPNIDELNTILKRHDGQGILVPGGVRAAMITPDYTPDNLVVDGILQLRGQSMHHGMRDVALWPKTEVQFIEMRAFSDDQNDFIRVVVRAPIGAFAPITWVLPKGQLASMSKRQIMQIIDPIVTFAAADEHTFENQREQHNSTAANAAKPPRPARPGCEWVTYTSAKYAFELLREHCPNDGPLSDQFNFQVHRKPAAQAIETAIRQQIVAHFQDVKARASCKVSQDPGEENPGWNEYSIKAFGPYAHPKVTKEQEMEKGEGFCDGWDGGDTTSFVLYNPSVTKELFFVYYGLSDPVSELPDDIFSLRMLPTQH